MELFAAARTSRPSFKDIWEAVFGPVCEDGFPCRLYDKATGAMNASIAAYWKENFDLKHIMERDWQDLGPKLLGKVTAPRPTRALPIAA